MADRLDHLRRQRALLLEHVAWLDAEIARETPSAVPVTPAQTETPSATSVTPPVSPLPDFNPASVHRDVRRGCWIYFSVALLLFGLGTLALYFLVARR